MRTDTAFGTIVIGGGLYGSCLALHHRAMRRHDVALIERSDSLLQRASYANQARVHNGYHYPRSFLTAIRSRANLPRFLTDFATCIDESFTKYYAIARNFSKVTATQFRQFCQRIGAPIEPAPSEVRKLFQPGLIEDVFLVREMAFNADVLREQLAGQLDHAKVTLMLSTEVTRLEDAGDGKMRVHYSGASGEGALISRAVYVCTYSRLNHLLQASDLPRIPLKHEVTELALVAPPPPLATLGITVMCGPFFSIMPFPARELHSFSHVRYTPHVEWTESARYACPDPYLVLERFAKRSRFREMQLDAQRYLPAIADATHRDSLWEIKTVLPRNEVDDGRPILMERHHGHPALTCVLGSKIDNVYDMMRLLDETERSKR